MARISRDVRFEARRDLFYSTPELETTPSIEENTLYQGTAFEYEGGFDGLALTVVVHNRVDGRVWTDHIQIYLHVAGTRDKHNFLNSFYFWLWFQSLD